MKRDMELARNILIAMESHEHGHAPSAFKIDGCSEEVVGYHVLLLGEAGLLRVLNTTHMGSTSPSAIPIALTWEGHEFLEAAKPHHLWERAKGLIQKSGNVMTLEALKAAFSVLIKQALSGATGS